MLRVGRLGEVPRRLGYMIKRRARIITRPRRYTIPGSYSKPTDYYRNRTYNLLLIDKINYYYTKRSLNYLNKGTTNIYEKSLVEGVIRALAIKVLIEKEPLGGFVKAP